MVADPEIVLSEIAVQIHKYFSIWGARGGGGGGEHKSTLLKEFCKRKQ